MGVWVILWWAGRLCQLSSLIVDEVNPDRGGGVGGLGVLCCYTKLRCRRQGGEVR